jgi:hypothetical protein
MAYPVYDTGIIDDIVQLSSDVRPVYTAGVITDIVQLYSDYATYFTSESLQTVPFKNPYSYRILDMMISGGVLTMNSSSYFVWSPTGSIVNPACDFWLDSTSREPVTGSSGAVGTYSLTHYIYHRQQSTGLQNLWYNGCIQTINTTTDGSLPFESFVTPENILVVIDASEDKPRLKVE